MTRQRIRSAGTLDFGKVVEQFAESTIERMDQIHRGVVQMVAYKLIYRTPFGAPHTWQRTPPKDYVPGKARGNWQTRFEQLPPATVLPIRDAAEAYAEAHDNSGVAGGVTYMLNSTPYILRLEYEGHSPQAPNGMARRTIAEFQQIVSDVVREGAK